jgi:hypothetical protein
VRIPTIIKFLQTDQALLIIVINLLLFGSIPSACYSQDLYNEVHSQKYAEYLYSSNQYTLAAEEYERLVFFDKNNVSFKYNLIKSYRLSGDLNSGIRRIFAFYGSSPDTMPPVLAEEFIKLQLLKDSLAVAGKFLEGKNKLSTEEKTVFLCYRLLLNGDYNSAGILAKDAASTFYSFPTSVIKLTQKASALKFKSPFIAGSLSTIIPGTGKFYTKNWADGIFSMIFVAGNAWQAYRGFNEHGIKSGYGWTFATLSASFYVGNVFGSVKAARWYNKNIKNEIDNKIFESIHSDSF